MAFTKAQLATEINTDPAALGYAALKAANDDQGIANLLNDLTVGASKNYTLNKARITASELQACVVVSEWATRSAAQQSGWQMLLIASSNDGVPTSSSNMIAQVQAIWNGTTTLTNINAARARTCTRAESLWGEGTTVTAADVSNALRN